jgi:two-component system, chemotaxis family, sensor kinase CheA
VTHQPSEPTLDETVREFLVESHENLDQLDRDLLALEADPRDHARIAAIFRTVHTIKGTSGFLGFGKLESLTHAGESLLSKLRDGALTLGPGTTSGLLALVDQVRAFLAAIESTGGEGDSDTRALADRLVRLAAGEEPATPVVAPPTTVVPAVVAAPALVVPVPSVEVAAPPPRQVPADASEAQSSAVSDTSVRVDVGLLDRLMNLVGELVLARNQIVQAGRRVEDGAFESAAQRLDLITTELQEGVMKTRMQPIGNVWNKLPRVVRDLAVACGKQVRMEMVGKETDLDRTILEAIKDPLTHVVRNAIDHGIEAPELRAARGKPKTGTLLLRAFHEGGQVNIEISDDGAGLDTQAVRQKAVQNAVVSADRAARMSERDLHQLIFLPGFSTAAKVSNVSGRGVGMDVVKTNIEKIGGTVDLQSRPGLGMTLRIKIPLTLAIVPALMVMSGGHRFAIPQVSLLELVRLEGAQARRGLETIHGTPVYRLRGSLLPLVRLDRCLGLVPVQRPEEEPIVNIVVVQADERQFGLVVDEIRDTEEIVVKPLGKELKSVAVFAGATIMGDGRVALILDVLGLAQRAGAVAADRDKARLDREVHGGDEPHAGEERQALLVFRLGAEGRMAIPLSLVARLEEFPADRLERIGRARVVQYRGEILPLVELAELFGVGAGPRSGPVSVVVHSDHGRSVGIVVDQILDIVEDTVTLSPRASRTGVLGVAVIQGKVTEMLDVRALTGGAESARAAGSAA